VCECARSAYYCVELGAVHRVSRFTTQRKGTKGSKFNATIECIEIMTKWNCRVVVCQQNKHHGSAEAVKYDCQNESLPVAQQWSERPFWNDDNDNDDNDHTVDQDAHELDSSLQHTTHYHYHYNNQCKCCDCSGGKWTTLWTNNTQHRNRWCSSKCRNVNINVNFNIKSKL
jgi:hypothetical protein